MCEVVEGMPLWTRVHGNGTGFVYQLSILRSVYTFEVVAFRPNAPKADKDNLYKKLSLSLKINSVAY